MDDALMDAAERVLFAAVGTRRQEYPQLVALREFLKAYLVAEPVLAGREVPSLEKTAGLSCAGAVEEGRRRREGIPPVLCA